MSPSRYRKPIHSPRAFRRARLTSSAPSRDTTMRVPALSSVRMSSSRSPRFSSRCEKLTILWEQTAGVLRLHHPLDADRHGGGAMRNLVLLRTLNHLRE